MASPLPKSCKDLHQHLFSYLKRIVSESLALVDDIHATKNIATCTIEELTAPQVSVEDVSNISTMHAPKKALTRSRVVGQLLDHTFAISEDSIISKVNMNELPDLDGEINRERRFTFNERLKGWNIIRRQRTNTKMCDTFYHHSKADKTFRSIIEVVNFIMYETYPTTQRKHQDGTVKAEISTKKRKQTSTMTDERKKLRPFKMTEEDVQEFMADAFSIFQDAAYGEELEMKNDFKYSDYFIFSKKENNFDSFSEENQQRNSVQNSSVEQGNGATQNLTFVPHDMIITHDTTEAEKASASETEDVANEVHHRTKEEFLPDIINEILEEDRNMTVDWKASPSKVVTRVYEEWIAHM